MLVKTGRHGRPLEHLAQRVHLPAVTLGFLFAYGAGKGSEDPAELLWQHPQLLQPQCLQLTHMEEIKYHAKPTQGTEASGTEQVSISSGIFQLGRRLHREAHPPWWLKCAAWLGASCWLSWSVHGAW